MKKIALIIAVLVLLQVVFVTTALADGPYHGGGGYGYGYNYHGYQNYHNSYNWWYKNYPRHYPNYSYNNYRWNQYPYRYNYGAWYGCNPCCRPTYYGYQRTHYWY